MRAKEFLSETAKRVSKVIPYQFEWTYYTITKRSPFGSYLRMEGDKIAVATINSKLIVWFMFAFGTPEKLGEFYRIDSLDELAPLGLQKGKQYTSDDLKAAHLYLKWDIAKKETRNTIASQFLNLNNLSPQFKQASTVYRGMQLSSDQIDALRKGDAIKLLPQRMIIVWHGEKCKLKEKV